MASFDPERINEWFAVGGVFTTIILWIYRKVILNTLKWITSVFRAPGSVAEVLAAIQDVKREIMETKAIARTSWDAIDKPVWQSDKHGLCIHVNRRFVEVLGCQISDALGNNWRTFIHQDDRQRVWREWDLAVEQKRDFNLRYRWVSKTGTVIWINASASRMTNNDTRELLGWVAFVEIEIPPTTP